MLTRHPRTALGVSCLSSCAWRFVWESRSLQSDARRERARARRGTWDIRRMLDTCLPGRVGPGSKDWCLHQRNSKMSRVGRRSILTRSSRYVRALPPSGNPDPAGQKPFGRGGSSDRGRPHGGLNVVGIRSTRPPKNYSRCTRLRFTTAVRSPAPVLNIRTMWPPMSALRR